MSIKKGSKPSEEVQPSRVIKKKSDLDKINNMFFSLFFILVGIVLFRLFFFQAVVEGESMSHTLSPGDVVWVKNKYLVDVDRGSIILFDNPFGEMTDSWYNIGDLTDFETPVRYVKRVVGIPGDRVEYGLDKVVINGEVYYERGYDTVEGQTMYEVTLGPDEVFVLGDNQEYSLDSRSFGPINRKLIIGEMIQTREDIDRYSSHYKESETIRLRKLQVDEALNTKG